MNQAPSIKAITHATIDRAFEELERADERRRPRSLEAGTGPGSKSDLFLKLVRRHAEPLEELEDATTPVLLLVDEGHGMTPHEVWASMLHSFRSRKRFHELIEVLTPSDLVPSQATVEQARRNAEARTQFLNEFPALTSAEVADLVGSRSQNRAALAHGWRKQGRIFSVPAGREQRYPLFQFDPETAGPKPQIARILGPLREAGLEGWQLALWWTGALASLDDRRPVDLLDDEPERVIEEAEAIEEIPQ